MVDFGREVCGNLELAGRREWLVTNGIGGFASGTVAGLLSRRYHGLLFAALKPPVGRTLLLVKLDETVTYLEQTYPIYCNRWASGTVEPNGFHALERFHLEGTTPVWTYACVDALLEKRIWMQQGANTTYISYKVARPLAHLSDHLDHPLELSIKALVNYRDYHAVTHFTDGLRMHVERVEGGLRVTALHGEASLYLLSSQARAVPHYEWFFDYYLDIEAARGEGTVEDHLCAGIFQVTLLPGEEFTLVASTEASPNLDGRKAYSDRQAHERKILAAAHRAAPEQGEIDLPALQPVDQLTLAADQFIVQRATSLEPEGCTVIAGYPWFSDWGRDTMISLPGLTLTTGRPEVARKILRTFAATLDQGMLPNRFPDAGEAPEYNTVDATLWYFEAIRAYHAATGDESTVRELFPVLKDIIDWHQRGTRYRIHCDPLDGLVYAGEPGVQLTWMDAKVDGWVVTPRIGKPVEINALWYNALCTMSEFARQLGEPAEAYSAAALTTRKGFTRFWNTDRGCLYDVLDGPEGPDASLRPNQIFAVSLHYSPLEPAQQQAVVESCAHNLLTSHGLRSLAPGEPGYVGHYGGDRVRRDGAYHQGTVWGWLTGPFVRAHLRVYRDPIQARSFLLPLFHHLNDHGLGSISEIFDGDPPFTPRGCIAQAWSVAEVLRAWQETHS